MCPNLMVHFNPNDSINRKQTVLYGVPLEVPLKIGSVPTIDLNH